MKPFGTGSALQQGLQAATAAIQRLAGGSVAQAVSGAAAPYLAEVIHDMTTTKGPDGKEVVNREANLMAHAVVGAVTAYAAGNSALAGASGAAMGEFIAQQLYPDIARENLTEEQRQTISALGTLAAGLAGGVAGDSTADAVAGAQAGKTSLENNTLDVPVTPPPVTGTNTGEAVSDANKTIASALDKAVKDIVESIDKATECSFGRACSSDEVAAQNQQHADGAGSKTETLPVNDDLTGGKLVNPAQDENKGTSLVTPDLSGKQGAGHTGNTEGAPDTGGNSTVSPIPGQNKDDLAYLAEGKDNRLPIPEPTIASNGLKVESNSKHTPGGQGFRPNTGVEPKNSLDLFEHSISTKDPKIRLSIDSNGNIHRFFNTSKDGTGAFHWSSSTGDGKNALGNRELGSFNKEIKELKGK